jgi:transcriptional regulator with XRE-family HTH domain
VLDAIDGDAIRQLRLELGLSQARFAMALRKAGAELGEPNGCNKRLVQKWENGDHRMVMPNYRRALAHVAGVPFATLCSHAPLPKRLDRIIAELTALRAELGDRAGR